MSLFDVPDLREFNLETLHLEIKMLSEIIKSLEKNTYYVYVITKPDGTPLYFGKGKGTRCLDHIRAYIKNKPNKKTVFFDRCYPEYPITTIIEFNLSESDAYKLESMYINEYKRIRDGGMLVNIQPGTDENGRWATFEQCSNGGKIGGKTTRSKSLGIFSDDYDRSSQSIENYKNGLGLGGMTTEQKTEAGRMGGNMSKDMKLGIFSDDLQKYRSEWARNAAKQVKNRGGYCSKEWMLANKEKVLENCSKGGKIGGLKMKGMVFWNDGVNCTRAAECPGDGWVRGMIRNNNKKKRDKDGVNG